MPTVTPIWLVLLIFAFVVFRVSNRAYVAYARGYKTWPILAVLAVIYVALFGVRFALHLFSPVFTIISLAILLISQAIFRSSQNTV